MPSPAVNSSSLGAAPINAASLTSIRIGTSASVPATFVPSIAIGFRDAHAASYQFAGQLPFGRSIDPSAE